MCIDLQTQGISVRSYYQDFDRNCMGYVTCSQVNVLQTFTVCFCVCTWSSGRTTWYFYLLDSFLITQFHRSFPGPSEVSESDIDLLASRYYDPGNGLCNYMKFNADIKSIWEGARKTVTFVPSAPAPPVCLVSSGSLAHNLMHSYEQFLSIDMHVCQELYGCLVWSYRNNKLLA